MCSDWLYSAICIPLVITVSIIQGILVKPFADEFLALRIVVSGHHSVAEIDNSSYELALLVGCLHQHTQRSHRMGTAPSDTTVSRESLSRECSEIIAKPPFHAISLRPKASIKQA